MKKSELRALIKEVLQEELDKIETEPAEADEPVVEEDPSVETEQLVESTVYDELDGLSDDDLYNAFSDYDMPDPLGISDDEITRRIHTDYFDRHGNQY
jgi:hypothetical protein